MSTVEVHDTIPRFELRHRLQLALEHADVSNAEMAAELGVAETTIRNYLSSRTTPHRGTLIAWALRCGVPFEWLAHGTVPGRDGGPGPDGTGTSDQYAPWDLNPEPADSVIYLNTWRDTADSGGMAA